jgi:putative spermidine/putrescine transport system substrate-binding protein
MRLRVMRKGLLIMALSAAVGITGCGGSSSSEEASVDYNSMSLEELEAQAKQEGEINSVGMPDTWADWKDTWADITEKYGLTHTDLDQSSAEEIALFKEEGKDATKDIGDVGQQWAPTAESEGVTLKYKTSYWDELPDWAKDEDGDWTVCYYGTMSIMTNTNLVSDPPTSFADILDGDYKVTIGDVVAGAQAQYAVLASAYAMGGDIDNMQPGYDFWKTLADQGRLDIGETSVARIESGEIECALLWDFNSLGYRDQAVENNPDAQFTACIPSDGSVQSGYASIINKYAPDPAAACLTREYILSDEGQLNLAKGYANPIRDIEIPADLQAKRIDSSQYGDNVHNVDYDKWESVCKDLVTYWQENIIPAVK